METDDKGHALSMIARQLNDSIISLLVDLQGETDTLHKRPLRFIENLECLLAPQHPRSAISTTVDVRRGTQTINATQDHRYVALSWTWEATAHENETAGSYHVQKRQGHEFEESKVRDCIFDRIFHYMRSIGVDRLWIDQHCIVQDTQDCKDARCMEHEACAEKREGMAVMDLVYAKSEHPVGLLGRPIASERELRHLYRLLRGKLTKGEESQLQLSVPIQTAWAVVSTLRKITDDDWWQRAWVFQENYKGGINMKLLIRNSDDLEPVKTILESRHRNPAFGNVRGELCIRSVDFFEQATRLCSAFEARIAKRGRIFKPRGLPSIKTMNTTIRNILDRAGRYKILLNSSEPMTPRIISDLYKKEITQKWDLLSIAANSCGYAIRLNGCELKNRKASLGLSILAQCLLNGEVLHNGRPTNARVARMTVPEYLKHAAFSGFDKRSLTFKKSCRFINPSLSRAGIQTEGHLWKLYKVIQTRSWRSSRARVDTLEGRLEDLQRRSLSYLAWWLGKRGHRDLAGSIRDFLSRDAWLAVMPDDASFADDYMLAMAEEIADAIGNGKPLILGLLWEPDNRRRPYMAFFVWDDDGGEDIGSGEEDEEEEDDDDVDDEDEDIGSGEEDEEEDDDDDDDDEVDEGYEEGSEGDDDDENDDEDSNAPGLFAFTASRPEVVSSEEMDLNDLDRHVSFQVDLQRGSASDGLGDAPVLRIQRWLPGLCFFRDMPRQEVVFPWPKDLASISP
ncbi:hypothetical protein B0T14DRAFT_569325 [Immersiella caudata]|uniref:Heterokaryon incompatibility domain-containing protein n=1 Tax=Immersiella caudata TaxID=314043 RepID=A0AA39WD89_9PEZI|nr:hypothetical protein B0T14DRAFT_569325 [Immersiella caudata]